jgi:hypothetical protein
MNCQFWQQVTPGHGGIYDRPEDEGFGPIHWTEAITTRPLTMAEARAHLPGRGVAGSRRILPPRTGPYPRYSDLFRIATSAAYLERISRRADRVNLHIHPLDSG